MTKAKPIDIRYCYVERYPIDYGQWVFVCRWRGFQGPVGMVWGALEGADKDKPGDAAIVRFNVYGSHVPEWARRCGVRTLINKEILSIAHMVVTQGATTKEGAEFMKASGYKRCPIGGYYLEGPRTKSPKSKAKRGV